MESEQLPEPRRDEIELAPLLAALADSTRLGMVAKLAASDGEMSCGSLTTCVTKSTASHHLKVLREAGVITQRPCGVARMNQLRVDDLDSRFPGLLASVVAAAEPDQS